MGTLEELEALFEEADRFEKRGNWVEDRKEILKNLTHDEIAAEILRLQAAHPERLSTPEQIRAKAERLYEAQTARRRAELVGA